LYKQLYRLFRRTTTGRARQARARGPNAVALAALRPGRYRVTVTATVGGRTSAPAARTLTVRRG
jgi:hypothetical protein